MSDDSWKLMKIDNLSDEQAKALYTVISNSNHNQAEIHKSSAYSLWVTVIISVLTLIMGALVVWLLTVTMDLSKRIEKLDSGMSSFDEKIDSLTTKKGR